MTLLSRLAPLAVALMALSALSAPAVAGSVTQGAMNPACPQLSAYGHPQPKDPKVARRGFHLCKLAYSAYYDPLTRGPLWVAQRLAGNVHGDEPRTNDFRADPDIPRGASPTNNDYARSGWDRGHMAPAEDFSRDPEAMSESFLFSNIVPQHPKNNRLAWKELESLTREWAKTRGEVYVLTGPIYNNGAPLERLGRSQVWVPTHIFKIIIDPRRGESVAFALPNREIPIQGDGSSRQARGAWRQVLANHRVSPVDIAAWTGFELHPALSAADKARLGAKSPMWAHR